MVDWSATAAWVTVLLTLIVSIITPAISRILERRYQLKIKKIEQYEKLYIQGFEKKRDLYTEFLRCTGKCISHANAECLQDAGKVIYEMYVYSPKDWWDDIDKINQFMVKYEWSNARLELTSLARKISDELNEELNKIKA